MRAMSKAGYGVEILFVFADEKRMRERASRREKATGRRVTGQQVSISLFLLHIRSARAPRI